MENISDHLNDAYSYDEHNLSEYEMQWNEYCEETIDIIDTIFFFFCVAIVILGVIGNSTAIIVLLWAKCRVTNSLNIYLIAVYVCDLGFLACISLQLAKIGQSTFRTWLSCEFSVYVVNVLSFASQWSMWAISAERYLAICYPMSLKYRRFSTVRSAVNVIVTFCVIGMALEIWIFFVVQTGATGECDLRVNTSSVFDTFNLVDSFLSYALPGIMIGFFTFSIFRALHGRRSTFRELDPSALRTPQNDRRAVSYETVVVISKGASQRVHRRERQAAWILMAIVLSDTMLNVQNYTLRLFNTFYDPEPRYCIVFRCIQVISYMLYYCQFATNVFYLIFCPSTRQLVGRKVSRHESASTMENQRKRSNESSCRGKMSASNSPISMHATFRDIGGHSSATPLILNNNRSASMVMENDDV